MKAIKFFVITIYLLFTFNTKAQNEVALIYFDCTEVFLNKNDNNIQTAVKNQLTKNSCIFTTDKLQANWIININSAVKPREQNQYGVYFCDAISDLSIAHAKSGLSIHEEVISEKGGNPGSFEKAALSASKEASENISKIILDKIFSEEFAYLQDENLALNTSKQRQANQSGSTGPMTFLVPPEMTILTPQNNSSYVQEFQKVEFEVETENLILENIEVDINGLRTTDISEFSFENGIGSFVIRLPSRGQCNLSIKTKNEHGYGKASVISLRRKNVVSKPRLNILAIGVSNYENVEIEDLDYAAKDATDFVKTLSELNKNIYEEINPQILTNENATKEKILDGLDWIERTSLQNDVSIIFIAGHGGVDNRDNYYFFPYEANPNSLRSSCLSYSQFNQTMETLIYDLESKAILFSDACHSGGAFKTRSALSSSVIDQLSSIEDGAFSFASSTGAQKSIENSTWENGAFTEALLKGLQGNADLNEDKIVSIVELITFSTDEVRKLTDNKQSPMHNTLRGNDFPLILISEN
jgi:hypothetical protein